MAHKQFLHELLKEDQEPFHLKTYISHRKSQIKKPNLQLTKRKPIIPTKRNNLCFLSFQNSPDVRRSPFWDLPSPAKSPTNAVAFLHIPSRTAALLVEAAMRVQKPPKSQGTKKAGFGLFGTFLKRLSKSKKCVTGTNDIKISEGNATLVERRISCSCSNRRLSSADWTENNEDKSLDFEASTSSRGSEDIDCDFGSSETRFCTSPFRFSLHRSPSSSGSRTPEFCSPAGSPSRHPKQDKEKYELSRNSDNVQLGDGEEEEDKEQCSPVSVLDPPFEDEGRESGYADEDDYDHDLECCYENVQRAKQQLLYRLRRFEKLAELDPIELERKLLEGSDEEDYGEQEESLEDEPLSQYTRLVSDLIVEEKGEMVNSGANDVVMGRVCKRFDSWKQVELNTIDMMVGLDLKGEFNGWTRFNEEVEETAAEIELAIFVVLVEELSVELSINIQEIDTVSC